MPQRWSIPTVSCCKYGMCGRSCQRMLQLSCHMGAVDLLIGMR
jgi:hypothetical protein